MLITNSKNKNACPCTLVNYANETYRKLQNKNTRTAIKVGMFKTVVSYSPQDIDEDFFSNNKDILNNERGNGLWLWKPYIIRKELAKLSEGEYLFYCDSGSYFINSINNVIMAIENAKQDVMPFELDFKESTWTKRDTFILMDCDAPRYINTKHRLAGFILFRKSKISLKFVDEWLRFSKDTRIITNSENTLGLPNYNDFIENRHDQSVFSLLTKKYGFQAFRDPSQYGNYFFELYPNSQYYEQTIVLTRMKEESWSVGFRRFVAKQKKTLQTFLIKTLLSNNGSAN